MSAAPSTGSGGAARLAAAVRNAIDRLDAAQGAGVDPDVFVEVGECLFWLIALADHLDAKDDLVNGLRWPRDRIAHGQIVTAPTHWQYGTELGRWVLGAGALGAISQHLWVSRPSVPNRRERRRDANWGPFYDAEVAGRPVSAILWAALTLLAAKADSPGR